MPRTKGSKNKVKAAANDYEALIAQAQKEKEEAEAEVAKTNASIEELKTDLQSMKETLKMQKADVKAAEKKLTKLEEKKAKADGYAESQEVKDSFAQYKDNMKTSLATSSRHPSMPYSRTQ